MNIDDRLEKLTERTDALTQSMELLVSMRKDTEKRLDRHKEEILGGAPAPKFASQLLS
ncbi:MAG: hypothetical protein ABSD75_01790 [Terriglobales bacterium]|jgi:hypothetical protein